MEGFAPDTYGESFADVYDRWYPDISDTEGTVAMLLALATSGLIIELGIGTGRLALPLVAAGKEVRGIDSSAAMIDELRKKPLAARIDVRIGNMADCDLGSAGEADLVFVAFNTFFNLPTGEQQQACMHLVSEVLAPGGRFVLETFVPPPAAELPTRGLSTKSVELDQVVLTATQTNADAQTISGQHIELSNDGIRLRPWLIRFASLEQLDAMAATAGLRLASRYGDWHKSPFGPTSESHVSVYEKHPD